MEIATGVRITWERVVEFAREVHEIAAVQKDVPTRDAAKLARLVLQFHEQLTGHAASTRPS